MSFSTFPQQMTPGIGNQFIGQQALTQSPWMSPLSYAGQSRATPPVLGVTGYYGQFGQDPLTAIAIQQFQQLQQLHQLQQLQQLQQILQFVQQLQHAGQQPQFGQFGQQPQFGQFGQQPQFGQLGQQPQFGQLGTFGNPWWAAQNTWSIPYGAGGGIGSPLGNQSVGSGLLGQIPQPQLTPVG